MIKQTTLALMFATLVGCAGQTQEKPVIEDELGMTALMSENDCCKTLGSISYTEVMKTGEVDVTITTLSPKLALKSGRTFAHGLSLPDALGTIDLTIYSVINQTVFVPTVLVLSRTHQVLDVIDSDDIQYSEDSILYKARYVGNYVLPQQYPDGQVPKYLVLITTEDALTTHSMPMAPSDFALQSGQVSANSSFYSNNEIKHTAIGQVTFDFDFEPAGALKETSTEQVTREESIDKYVEGSFEPTLTLEQEQAFNRAIDSAVSEGSFEKALKLSNEATKLGSPSAKKAFIDAMKRY